MTDAVIVASKRTAVGKAPRGALRDVRPDDMASDVIQSLLKVVPEMAPSTIDDILIGCAMPEGEQGMNVARIASLKAGIPYSVPAATINRFCSSGLQTIAMASERIMLGFADVILAGGTETMSLVPMGGNRILPNPDLVEFAPKTYLNMGLTAEVVAKKYGVARDAQDAFAYESHRRAAAAVASGAFTDEIIPLQLKRTIVNGKGKRETIQTTFSVDEGPRADTTIEKLSTLKPVFQKDGTVTAGNASQMSDGAALSVVMSATKAKELGLKPLARFVAFAVAGVPPEEMGIGPIQAIPKALKMAGLSLNDIGLIELNEAFAAQSLAVINALGIDTAITNVHGGAIALGHPLGATGAKLTATLLHEMTRRQVRYGMVSMCIGGGMGAAGIFERM